LEKYTATEVLDKLANFVVGVRARYGIDGDDIGVGVQRTVIVGHDWGCALSMRLASEAPVLADRFVLSNGPLVCLHGLPESEGWTNKYRSVWRFLMPAV